MNGIFGFVFMSLPCVSEVNTQRGRFSIHGGVPIERQTLPEDPIGTTTVTFAGVNANSEIRVYLPDGTALAGIEDCAANQVLTWSVYAPGANSVVTIRIVNTAYKIKEFDYTPVVGTQSLPIQQEPDKWYSNPV